jgi:hypothetical protein
MLWATGLVFFKTQFLLGSEAPRPSLQLPIIIVEAYGFQITNQTKATAEILVLTPFPLGSERSCFLPVPGFTQRTAFLARIWVRGSSSAAYPKKPYRLELVDEGGSGLKSALLGMPRESDWILFPAYTDKTLMRDVLAYELWREMGHYAVRWRYVELFIRKSEIRNPKSEANPNAENGKLEGGRAVSGAEGYEGVYVLMEKIKRGRHRLNIEKVRPEDSKEPEIAGGYIFKKDRLNPGETGFKSSQRIHFAFEEPKERDITPAQKQWLTNYVNEFERVLFSEAFADPINGYAKYIDVESFIDYHWMVEATRNIDGYRWSQFYHKDRGGKLRAGPIWDWDLSFGNAAYFNGYKTNGWRWAEMLGADYAWYNRLFDDPEFVQKYIDRWAVLRTNVFATSNILARIDTWAAYLHEAQARNYQRWPTIGKFVHPNRYIGRSFQEEVDWLKQWIRDRLSWIDSQGFPAPLFELAASSGALGMELCMSGQVGKIYFTLDGSDPRLPGGKVSPVAIEYHSPITPVPGAMFTARVLSEYDLWSPPAIFRW